MVKPQKPDPQRPQKPQKQQKPGWKIKITTKKTLNIYPPFPCLPLLACWLAGFLACLLAGWLACLPTCLLAGFSIGNWFLKKNPREIWKNPGKIPKPPWHGSWLRPIPCNTTRDLYPVLLVKCGATFKYTHILCTVITVIFYCYENFQFGCASHL